MEDQIQQKDLNFQLEFPKINPKLSIFIQPIALNQNQIKKDQSWNHLLTMKQITQNQRINESKDNKKSIMKHFYE